MNFVNNIINKNIYQSILLTLHFLVLPNSCKGFYFDNRRGAVFPLLCKCSISTDSDLIVSMFSSYSTCSSSAAFSLDYLVFLMACFLGGFTSGSFCILIWFCGHSTLSVNNWYIYFDFSCAIAIISSWSIPALLAVGFSVFDSLLMIVA